MKTGFDNEKYLQMQSSHIRERISHFDNKLYLEFGGKLFDDYHASRVLPGFQPNSKMRMLMQLSSQAEIIIVISADDIEKNKIRGDLGITYDVDVLRLMSVFKSHGLFVGSVVITKYSGQESAARITLAPGTYFVTYHISAVLEEAGYLQVTPAYNGTAHLEYGVYARTADPDVTVSGSNAFIVVAPEETVLTLNVNTSTATRDGAATLVILGLQPPEA